MSDYDNFFDGVGGGGAPGFKFNGVGSGVKGTVVDQYQTVVTAYGTGETLTYPDGTEIPQLNVTLQTELRNWDNCTSIPKDENSEPKPASEDDGLRRVFIKYDMRRAVAVAVRSAKAAGLRTGGTLAIKHSGNKPTTKGNPLPLYEARYEAPAASDSFLGEAKAEEVKPFGGKEPQYNGPAPF